MIWRERFLKLRTISLILLITFSVNYFSDEPIDEKLKRLSKEVAEIATKEASIKDKISLLKRRVMLSQVMLDQLKKEKSELTSELELLKTEIESIKIEEDEIMKYFKARLKLTYLTGVMAQYRVLFSSENSSELLETNYLLTSLNIKDNREVERIKNLKESKTKKEEEILNKMKKIEEVERETIKERERHNEEIQATNKLFEEISKDGDLARKHLSETIENARKMDSYFNDLNFRKKIELYQSNIHIYKGSLDKPVKGRIVQGFGDYNHPKFKTRLPHPGIDFSAPFGAAVNSIFDGEVVLADWLSGYGFTVIVGHPGGVYSMYSHLDRIDVKTGEVVKRGSPVGAVGGDPTKNYSGIYFELREGKVAEDPEKWFKE